jgi:hypothetical protein
LQGHHAAGALFKNYDEATFGVKFESFERNTKKICVRAAAGPIVEPVMAYHQVRQN